MRLTLRTLLAYLDDTLDPGQAKIIGQKVAESDQARELMEHIKQVTRRRRITTPPANGHGSKIDPNTIAEYLDSAVSAEQAGEVEQICLSSDAHLAEVAACHQILALVLGEPALVPPTAKSRMYGLVKGPESIPFRKPTSPSLAEHEQLPAGDDVDETLRMGMPSLADGGKWKQSLLLVGSGFMAAVLLGLAIWHLLNLSSGDDHAGKGHVTPPVEIAKNDHDKKPPDTTTKIDNSKVSAPPVVIVPDPKVGKEGSAVEPPPFKQPATGSGDHVDTLPPPFSDKDKGTLPPVKQSAAVLPEFRNTAPDNRPFRIGKYVMPVSAENSVLVNSVIGKGDWTRLWGKNLDVESGREVVAFPGCVGQLSMDRGIELTLWGSMPEILPTPLLFEAVVDLHNNDEYDLDMTLVRGRVVIATRGEKATVRIRFENPAAANEFEIADMLLTGKGTQLIIDRFGSFIGQPPPFLKDPKNPDRIPPTAFQGFCVTKGSVTFRLGRDSYGLTAPPGSAMMIWNSVDGLKPPQKVDEVPKVFSLSGTPPTFPKEIDKKIRDGFIKARNDLLKARDDLSALMIGKAVDVCLAEIVKSADVSRRILGVRCYAALGSLADLVDALTDERSDDTRQTAIRSLQNWISVGRDNEYKLFDQLKTRFTPGESEKIMELLHGFTPPEVLVDNLNNSSLTIREMSFLNLISMAGHLLPQGQGPPQYSPTMPPDLRMAAQQAWRELLRRRPNTPPPPQPPKG